MVSAIPDEAPPVRADPVSCPQCGAAIPQRAFGYARTIGCEHCGTVLDASTPSLKIVAREQQRIREAELRIPLGTRGTLFGRPWEAVGIQRREIRVDGSVYAWREYVLFNPVHGFRYLVEYDGHWTWVEPMRRTPSRDGTKGNAPVMRLGDERYRHFQTAVAETTVVLGEFPWEARVGDRATCADYVAPPHVLSSEVVEDEQSWSRGTYVEPGAVYEAFELGSPPSPRGIYANEPNPWVARREAMWPVFLATLVAVVAITFGWYATAQERRVLETSRVYEPRGDAIEPEAFVTDTFVLGGRTSNLELAWSAQLDQSWLYLDLALVDLHRGTATELGRELSFYYGVDGGERWSEGDRDETVVIPEVAAGTYYLRVAPSGPATGPPIAYALALTRDVPRPLFSFLAVLLAAIPMGIVSLQAHGFETKRWMESDHPPVSSDDDE